MQNLTVTSDFRLIVPEPVLRAANLAPGDQVRVRADGDRIELARLKRMSDYRGVLQGMDTAIKRDDEDRLP